MSPEECNANLYRLARCLGITKVATGTNQLLEVSTTLGMRTITPTISGTAIESSRL
jgi:hypothetical protein